MKMLVSVLDPALPLPLKVRVSEVGMGVASAQIFRVFAQIPSLARLIPYLDLSVMLHSCTYPLCVWKETACSWIWFKLWMTGYTP